LLFFICSGVYAKSSKINYNLGGKTRTEDVLKSNTIVNGNRPYQSMQVGYKKRQLGAGSGKFKLQSLKLSMKEDNETKMGRLLVVPNPARITESFLCFRLNQDLNLQLIVFDRKGRQLGEIERAFVSDYIKVPMIEIVNELSAGIYFVVVKHKNEIMAKTKFEVSP